MDFKLNRLASYSDQALLAELRRVAALLPNGPLTRSAFEGHARARSSTVIRRFGGWRQALEAAGLAARYSGAVVSPRMGNQPGRSASQDEILRELRRVAAVTGRPSFTVEDFDAHATFSSTTVRAAFPLWKDALTAAGLTPRPTALRYSDEECFENLLRVWTALARAPQYREMGRPPSTVGGKAYVIRWGTWLLALEAFLERVQADNSAAPAPPASYESAAAPPPIVEEPADDGHIRLGIRYRVLVRDRFRCVLCGSSPAIDAACRLHVDHVHPFSKGGPTVPENLRTLCEACNLGKGSLTIEGAS